MRLLAQDSGTFFGTIKPPAALEPYGQYGGLIVFASNMLRLLVLVGGLFALLNIVLAGYGYITSSGDPKAHERASNLLTMSFIGLVIMVGAPAIAAIIGYVFFKDPTFILQPKVIGPETTSLIGGAPYVA